MADNKVSDMPMRTIGKTGMKVSALCLGAMMFGAWGNPDHEDSIKVIHKALDSGINFVDTADVYSAGESEEIVGKALKGGKRNNVILATKVHGSMGDDPNHFGNSRRWIMQEVDNSLKRLQTDWIDLYQIHRPDPDTDIDETLGALTDLVRMGKIRAFGSSTFPASQIVEAQWIAENRDRERFICEQRFADITALQYGSHSMESTSWRLVIRKMEEGTRCTKNQSQSKTAGDVRFNKAA
jgi:aryl-alcohol dehydrogenase-like predicted oxidoreductase